MHACTYFMQTLATLLMMMSVLTICIIVHILTNIQKKVAFHKIEKSVSTHLDVNNENSKQVSNLLWHIIIIVCMRVKFVNDSVYVYLFCIIIILSYHRKSYCCPSSRRMLPLLYRGTSRRDI